MLFNRFEKLHKIVNEIKHKIILCNIRLDILSKLGSYEKENKLIKKWSQGLKNELKEIKKCVNYREAQEYLNDVNEIYNKLLKFGLTNEDKRHIVYYS